MNNELKSFVIDHMESNLGLEASYIKENLNFSLSEFDADSLDVVEMVMAIEGEFDISVDEDLFDDTQNTSLKVFLDKISELI